MPKFTPRVISAGPDPYTVLNTAHPSWETSPPNDTEPRPIHIRIVKRRDVYRLLAVASESQRASGSGPFGDLRPEIVRTAGQCRTDWIESLIDLQRTARPKYPLRSTFDLSSVDGLSAQIKSDVLPLLARQGRAMLDLLFYDTINDQGLRDFADDLLSRGSGLERLTVSSDELFLPWDLAYVGDPEEAEFGEFLGLRWLVQEQVMPAVGRHEDSNSDHASEPACIFAASPDDVPPSVLDAHNAIRNELAKLEGCELVETRTARDLRRALSDGGFRRMVFAYLYGHGTDGERIRFEDGEFRREDLVTIARGGSWASGPVVFLNNCSSAVDGGRDYRGFGRMFVQVGALGAVGAQTAVPTVFASEFARMVVETLIGQNATVGHALFVARRQMLNQYENPIGLLYSIYHARDLKLSLRVRLLPVGAASAN